MSFARRLQNICGVLERAGLGRSVGDMRNGVRPPVGWPSRLPKPPNGSRPIGRSGKERFARPWTRRS